MPRRRMARPTPSARHAGPDPLYAGVRSSMATPKAAVGGRTSVSGAGPHQPFEKVLVVAGPSCRHHHLGDPSSPIGMALEFGAPEMLRSMLLAGEECRLGHRRFGDEGQREFHLGLAAVGQGCLARE